MYPLDERPAGALAAPSLLLSHFLTHYRNLGRTAVDGGGGRWLGRSSGPFFRSWDYDCFALFSQFLQLLLLTASSPYHRPDLDVKLHEDFDACHYLAAIAAVVLASLACQRAFRSLHQQSLIL